MQPVYLIKCLVRNQYLRSITKSNETITFGGVVTAKVFAYELEARNVAFDIVKKQNEKYLTIIEILR